MPRSAQLLLGRSSVIALVMLVAHAGTAAQSSSVYTAQQSEAGRAAYAAHCANCHAADLGGRNEAPPLAGSAFMDSWKGRTTKDLLSYVQGMPPGGESLTPEQYLDITAHILHQNGAPAGGQPYADTTAVAIGAIATGQRPSAK